MCPFGAGVLENKLVYTVSQCLLNTLDVAQNAHALAVKKTQVNQAGAHALFT